MLVVILLVSALLLSFERITYFLVSRYPDGWCRLCQRPPLASFGGPVNALHGLFYAFKAIQGAVFLYWWMVFGDTWIPLPTAEGIALIVGVLLIGAGIFLNGIVFNRLGRTGVFYGAQIGYDVPWITGFPFSVMRHPQYLGALFCIWGLFVVMRFPHDDWFYLPLMETAFYAWGAYKEP